MVNKDQLKVRWDFRIQSDKLVIAAQLDIVEMDKQKKVAVDAEIPRNRIIRKKEYKSLRNNKNERK